MSSEDVSSLSAAPAPSPPKKRRVPFLAVLLIVVLFSRDGKRQRVLWQGP